MDLELLQRFGVALAIGLLVGLERERSHEDRQDFAGIRTFPLFSLLGAILAWISTDIGPGLVIAGFAGVALLVTVAYAVTASGEGDRGATTEVAALVVYGLGVKCMIGALELAAALGVVVYLLLALRRPLRSLAGKLETRDLVAIGKLGALTLLVLPLVPDRPIGPWGVLNLRTIWILVILIASVGFVGYLLVKFVGARRGFGLTGLVGGLASSTAVTLSFSQKTRTNPALAVPASLAIVLACTTMFPRVLAILAVVYAPLVMPLVPAFATMTLTGSVICLFLWRKARDADVDDAVFDVRNPFELVPAIKFALLFAVVLVGARALGVWLGEAGVYLSGVAAGLTDVDAVALSMAQFGDAGSIGLDVAATATVLAAISNSVAKGVIAATLAGGRARVLVSVSLVGIAATGGAALGVQALLRAFGGG